MWETCNNLSLGTETKNKMQERTFHTPVEGLVYDTQEVESHGRQPLYLFVVNVLLHRHLRDLMLLGKCRVFTHFPAILGRESLRKGWGS